MSAFEYEERYKVIDLEVTRHELTQANFTLTRRETQTDRWFIPQEITSHEAQKRWFDHQAGQAIRLRTTSDDPPIITIKQFITPGDHSSMANHEGITSAASLREVLSFAGDEFAGYMRELENSNEGKIFSADVVKRALAAAGRREYLVLEKFRETYKNANLPQLVVDVDEIPALQGSELGFSAAIEFEYRGDGSLNDAQRTIKAITQRLGYRQEDVLQKGLPGLAVEYLAEL